MDAIPTVDAAGTGTGARAASPDVLEAAREWLHAGFRRLFVQAADGEATGASGALVERLLRDGSAECMVAGDIDSGDRIERYLADGAAQLVVGARGMDEPEWLVGVAGAFPGAIVLETAIRNRRVSRRGWTRTLPIDVLDLAAELASLPLGGMLVTGVDLDAAERASTLALLEDLAQASGSRVLVAPRDGVSCVDDLHALEHRGVAAVVLGQELLDGRLDPRAVAREFGG